MKTERKSILIIDGKSWFYRGFYAMPGLRTSSGQPTGGIFGFASLLFESIRRLKPRYVAVAWDKSGTNIRRRKEIYAGYKSGRKKAPDEFYEQIEPLRKMISAFGIPFFECDDYEADDIMATLADQAVEKGLSVDLVSSDLDMLQILAPHVQFFALKKGLSSIEEYTDKTFEEKYGIDVRQFLDFKALRGDASDNIPGVAGIGPKTAVKLLQDFGSLDGVYENLDRVSPDRLREKLRTGKEMAEMSRKLARLMDDAPVKLDLGEADVQNSDIESWTQELKELEFSSLLRRLQGILPVLTGGGESDADRGAISAIGYTEDSISSRKNGEAGVVVEHETQNVNFADVDWSKNSEVYLSFDLNKLYGSTDGQGVFTLSAEELSAAMEKLRNWHVIAADVKRLYHFLFNKGVEVEFRRAYDVGQAAFLLNPLAQDTTFANLTTAGDRALPVLKRVREDQIIEFKKVPLLLEVAEKFDFPLTYILFKMEAVGIKIDPERFAKLDTELTEELGKTEQEIYKVAGTEFNIGSPMQLADVLFNKLGLPTKGIKRNKTGFGTGQSELNKLRGLSPIIELIERSRELAKIKNTYVDTIPKLADGDLRVHTTFTQNVTSTGRLSSLNPNLQNIPVRTDLGKRVREGFVPGEGRVFVNADYSQFELRLAAVLAGDKKLIEDFNSGVDVHTKTAADVFGVPIGEVTKKQRRAAKVINFGVLYGMSPHGLSAAADMTRDEAQKFINDYFELRAPIKEYSERVLREAKERGYVQTFYGRRRPTPDIDSPSFVVREAARRAAVNMPIQGTEADLMKRAMILLNKYLEANVSGGEAFQVLQIHDSVMLECVESRAEGLAAKMREIMEGVAPELDVKLAVETSIGKNWGEL